MPICYDDLLLALLPRGPYKLHDGQRGGAAKSGLTCISSVSYDVVQPNIASSKNNAFTLLPDKLNTYYFPLTSYQLSSVQKSTLFSFHDAVCTRTLVDYKQETGDEQLDCHFFDYNISPAINYRVGQTSGS